MRVPLIYFPISRHRCCIWDSLICAILGSKVGASCVALVESNGSYIVSGNYREKNWVYLLVYNCRAQLCNE